MSLFPYDELNTIKGAVQILIDEGQSVELVEDTIEDLLIMAYVFGGDQAAQDLQSEKENHIDKLEAALNKEIADKTWRDRIEEYYLTGDIESIDRVIDTETHRLYNTGAFDTAEDVPEAKKRWDTMKDERVRDTHQYLEGEAVPLDELFYTFDGDSARFPGDFTLPENNVNCRCELSFVR